MDVGKKEGARPSPALSLYGRTLLQLEGVEDVLSFDDRGAYLKTVDGGLAIDGEELHIESLSPEKGTLTLQGRIRGLFYDDAPVKKKSGLFGRKR